MKTLLRSAFMGACVLSAAVRAQSPDLLADRVSVTVLTTNTADLGVGGQQGVTQGEWSFAAWVEVGDRAILFDTGWSPDNVLANAETLGIDLSVAEDLVLSHHHDDHTGGLETLRRELSKKNPAALSRIHVAEGIFRSRPLADGGERNSMPALRDRIEATGATFIIYDRPTEISPGVWVTGPVPRVHAETNYPVGPNWQVVGDDGRQVADTVPDSQSLVIVTPDGQIMLSGCGHAGLVNTLEYVSTRISDHPPQAAIGGFHLYAATSEVMSWTSERIADLGLRHFVGAHCTGIESVFTIREWRVSTVIPLGTRYEAGRGMIPGNINR